MHVLPLEWSNRSWLYQQVSRDGDLAIYRQQHKEGPAVRFEVIRVQHRDETTLHNGSIQEAGEYYPSSSQWGKAGWTCYTLAEARQMLNELHA
jgi:hypothetical protein